MAGRPAVYGPGLPAGLPAGGAGLCPPPPVLIESDNICRAAVLPVHALNIGARAKNSLKKHGIKTALQLIQMPPERLLNMPGIGKDSFARVAIALWKEGLYLGVQLAPGQKKAMQPPDLPPEQKLQSLSLPAESLNLSVRASRRLHQEGIHYIRDLVQITEEELLLIEGIGAGSVREIRQALTQKGLSLGMGLRLASPPRLQERESGPHAKPLEKAPAGASPANNKESEAAFRPPDFVYKGDAAASAPPGFSAEQMQFFSSSVKAGSLGLQRRAWKTLVLEGIQHVWELAGIDTELLIKRPGFNKRNIDRLREAFSKHGWELEREFGDRQLEEIWGAKILKFPDRRRKN